ncbi:macrolide transporter subunit MacA [Providencia vermicola]|uniref:Macrolide transporter subunit MacA n=1 Tax=Providencia vermicola TaxID=333965 RepID=A0AAX3RVY5_9GAMM|nr:MULTISPECIES: macrolide transporter subunit MacA [Providencia]ELR5120651.1 macrolide transporter subunit MacA [Providencia stuartii]ELR5143183.1 macrolide transporter subunit MacA [Providencia stuartii]ELX8380174.1 macrolide transporter subunit MacA [Providencia stuartii]ELZ5941159.1 macrolide transporter subunit MacA [Providencia stuartii]EMD5259711.1 macrolide transporter subunit MacA [Providencia stuartii]
MRANSRKKKWLISLSVILILMVIALLFFGGEQKEVFQTVSVTRGDLNKQVQATGKLDAVRKVDVGAQVSGQLQTLYVKEGDNVKKGDLLAVIDPQKAQNDVTESQETIHELESNLALAKAELRLAEVTYQRQLSLSKLQAVSKQDLDKAQTDVEVKKAQVATYQSQIKRNQATLDTAKTNLKYTQITAPMDGIVTFIKTLQGQTVIAAQEAPTILTLADLDTMLVKTEVSEADVIYLKPGQAASFTVLGAPDKRFSGVLKDILPTPEKINDAIFYYARFEVPNPQHLLKLQMTAQVQIDLESHKDVLLLPLSALGTEVSPQVYDVEILNGENAEKRQIKIGSRNDIYVEVIDGLKEGEQVITSRSTVD